MEARRILNVLGNVKDSYIEALYAEESRRPGKTRPVWLIAALVAVMLLLVGCAVVYMLRMQDLTVGELRDEIPIVFDENGDRIPIETREPTIMLSLQNTNMEALAEWLAFTENYDKDGKIMSEADKAMKSGHPWNIPDNYHYTYGCYSKEMQAKLEEIVEKYELELLSASETFMYYQSQAMLECLGIDALVYDDTGMEYWGGTLYLEGSFDMEILLNLDMGDWFTKDSWLSYRYSLKEYFDPLTGGMKASESYMQWDYTRKDGLTVLLILNENTARIYADLPDAFISISVDPVIFVDGEETPMTKEALEQMAEFFDLSIQPQPTTLENVRKYQADSQDSYDAQREAALAKAEEELQNSMTKGYEELAKYHLENSIDPKRVSYILWDINGDSIEEMVVDGIKIYSLNNEEAYLYFDISDAGPIGCRFRPCEGNVFEVYTEYDFVTENQYFFYKANVESTEFITGVTYNTRQDIWYRNLTDGFESQKEEITVEEALRILAQFSRIDFDWLPLIKFGQPVLSAMYTDPYSKYIADRLDRFEEAVNYSYTLMDLNGDGQKELITRDQIVEHNGERSLELNVHAIKNGKIHNMGLYGFNYICEGGILESSADDGDSGAHYAYYAVTAERVEMIEKVVREPYYEYWGHAVGNQTGNAVSEEKAMSIINSYERIELDMKPFTEYPFA